MNIDDNQYQQQPLRRSQRLRNKQNGNNGSQLTGDKRYIFTHDFNEDNMKRKKKQNIENNYNNDRNKSNTNKNHNIIYPTISRCARKLQVVHTSPNVFIIENFLTEKEITHLLSIAKMNKEKFETSYTQASSTDQIYSKERTSTFIFLQKYMDRISRSIERRAAEIVSIPIENVEPLQVVRYTDGQEFTLHHDAGTLINETVKKSSSSSLWSVDSHSSNHSHHSNISNISNVSNVSNHSNMSYSVNSNHSNGSNASIGANSYGGHSMDYIYNQQFLNNCNNINMNSSNYHQQSNFSLSHCMMNNKNQNGPHQNMNHMNQNMNGNVMHTMNNINNMNTTNFNKNFNVNSNCQNIMNQNVNNNNNNHYNQTQNNNFNRINHNSSVHSKHIKPTNDTSFPAQIRQLEQIQMQQYLQSSSTSSSSSSPQCPASPITPSSPIPPANQMCSAQYAQYFQKFQQMANQRKQEILLAQQGMAQAQRIYNNQNCQMNININHNNHNNCNNNTMLARPSYPANLHSQTGGNHSNREQYYRPSQSCPPLSSQLQVFRMDPSSDNHNNHQNNNNLNRSAPADNVKTEKKEMSTDYHMNNIMEEDEEDDEDEKCNLSKEEIAEQFNEYSVQMVTPIRLCSYFVYLTTLPEGAGGETYFPKLGLKVRPERGKAILWCNVDPENTSKADPMLIHRAMPVKGDHEKIGMNIWINGSKVDSIYR